MRSSFKDWRTLNGHSVMRTYENTRSGLQQSDESVLNHVLRATIQCFLICAWPSVCLGGGVTTLATNSAARRISPRVLEGSVGLTKLHWQDSGSMSRM